MKKQYYLVKRKNVADNGRIIEAIDKFSAIAIAVEKDGHKYSNIDYTAKKTKL